MKSKDNVVIYTNERGQVSLQETTRILEKHEDKLLTLVRRTYPYKFPSNYLHWRYLSSAIAMGLSCVEAGAKTYWKDRASYLHSHKCALWFVNSSPVYCMKSDLLQAMLQTDIGSNAKVLQEIRVNIPGFILLFPHANIITPDSTSLDFCLVHLSDRDRPERSSGSKHGIEVPHLSQQHKINIHWSAIDNFGTVWYSGAGLTDDGTVEYSEIPLGLAEITNKDKEFLKTMRSLVLQVYLLLQFQPDRLTDVQSSEVIIPSKVKGFAPINNSEKFLYPRWLGRKYETKTSPSYKENTSTHASPITHWRRGHWREAAVGQGRQEKKWIWIEPMIING